jgi:4-hydroxybenzoate polyprenyltransferase
MIAFLKLVRYQNLLMVLLTLILTKYVLIDSFNSINGLSHFNFSILCISIISITAAGYIINDIFDIETDQINKPNSILINHSISIDSAKSYYKFLNIIGVLSGVFVSFSVEQVTYSLIFFSTAYLLYIYSKKIKRTALIGNILVSFLVSLSILTVYIFETSAVQKSDTFVKAINQLFNNLSLSLITLGYAYFAFSLTLLREIIKDIEDIKGDYAAQMKTLPIVLGINRTSKIAFFISSVVFVSLVFITKDLLNNLYFAIYGALFVYLPFLWYLSKLWMATTSEQFKRLSLLLKWIMFFGILSILLFKIQ